MSVLRRRSRMDLFAVLVFLVACKQSGTLVTPPSFDRPADLAFVCLEPDAMGVLQIVPLSACDGIDEDDDDETKKLVALVTQTATGEVGAVDLAEGDVLDSDPAVPGYTFRRVGESPSGIAVSSDGLITYVATFGSRAITPIATEELLGGLVSSSNPPAYADLVLDEGPSDLLLFEQGGVAFLYAPLPAAGVVVEIPLDGVGGFGTPRELTFGVPGAVPAAIDETVTYTFECPVEPVPLPARATDRVASAAGTPRPVRVRLDASSSTPVLLVADEGQPVVHRFQLTATGAVPIEGISSLVPTIDVVATPAVPLSEGMLPTERYLYAIDAIGGGVFVVDYGASSPTFGTVLAVNGAGGFQAPDIRDQTDRVPLGARARTLEVATPGGVDPSTPDCATRADDVGPDRLNGVFVVAGLDDGTVAFIDIYDRDASCRAVTPECTTHPRSGDVAVHVRRHRPRLGTLRDEPGIEIIGAPRMLIGTTVRSVDDSGATSDGPVLASVSCDPTSGYRPLFPTTGTTPRICTLADPWSVVNQTWRATWEGALPNTSTLVGALDRGTGVVTTSGQDLCALGILGSADVPTGTEPESAYRGDQLEVLSELPPSTRDDPLCDRFVIPDEDSREPITFAITDATQGALTLGTPLEIGYTLADVDRCFLSSIRFQVRSRESFVVTGSVSGFTHRIFADAGACAVDVAGQPYDPSDPRTARFGRAIPDVTGTRFVHPLVYFTLDSTLPVAAGDTAELAFDIGSVPLRLQYDISLASTASAVPESIVYNPEDARLYVVDIAGSAVVRYDLDPVALRDGFK